MSRLDGDQIIQRPPCKHAIDKAGLMEKCFVVAESALGCLFIITLSGLCNRSVLSGRARAELRLSHVKQKRGERAWDEEGNDGRMNGDLQDCEIREPVPAIGNSDEIALCSISNMLYPDVRLPFSSHGSNGCASQRRLKSCDEMVMPPNPRLMVNAKHPSVAHPHATSQ